MQNVYLDIETTGLDPSEDEILEIAIVEENGTVLLDSLVKPYYHKQWNEAQAIHGISPAMVANSPKLIRLLKLITTAVKGRDVYIWHANFDTAFLPHIKTQANSVTCAMQEFGDYIEKTQPQNKSQSGRYKMANTAKDLNIKMINEHRALGDVKTMIAIRKTYLSPSFNRTDLSGSKHVPAYKELAC